MPMIADFHCHILPGIDDGSQSVRESIAMLQEEAMQGIRLVVATPHFYPRQDNPQEFLRKRAESERVLRDAMAQCKGLPELHIGAEVHYFRGIGESDILPLMTIDGKKHVLIEMPMTQWTEAMYRDLENISARQGLIPILAHIERYLSFQPPQRIWSNLEQFPVLIQSNASFFQRTFGSGRAFRLLRDGKIHLLGSDCHNMTNRKPNLGKTLHKIQKKLGFQPSFVIDACQNQILKSDPTTKP